MTDPRPLLVLVPGSYGVAALDGHPYLRALRYDGASAPTPEQAPAEVLVIGLLTQPGDLQRTVDLIHRLPALELVQTLNAGYEQWEGRLPPGVRLANCRGAHGRSTAEWVVGALLDHYRGFSAFTRSQERRSWDWQLRPTLDGARVTVLGAGDIANHVRAMLEPFGVHVTLVGRSARPGVTAAADLPAVLGEQDAVVLAVPVTAETTAMVDKAFLARMKDGAVLVNAGRGVLVDTGALMAEAGSGRLRAVLDVTEPEPLPPEHPLWATPGVVITPHVAGSTEGVRERAWAVALSQIEQWARGEAPENLVG